MDLLTLFTGLTFSPLTLSASYHLGKASIVYLKVRTFKSAIFLLWNSKMIRLAGRMDDWIIVIVGRVKALAFAWGIRSFPLLNNTYHYFLPSSLRQQGAKHMAYSRAKVSK